MRTILRIDRHFHFLHGNNLSVFAERILRNTEKNPYVEKPDQLWDLLHESNAALRKVLEDRFIKQKERTMLIRKLEVPVAFALEKVALYVEETAPCKSDIITTGFRPLTEHRKDMSDLRATNRRRRLEVVMSNRQAQIAV